MPGKQGDRDENQRLLLTTISCAGAISQEASETDAVLRWLSRAAGEIFIPAADQMSSSGLADFI